MLTGVTSWFVSRNLLGFILFLGLLPGLAQSLWAAEEFPLRPVDTSSPRASMQSFFTLTDSFYRHAAAAIESYGPSNSLYLNAEERQIQRSVFTDAFKAIQMLDVSQILPVLRSAVAVERMIQFREILDRIDVPDFADIPDRDAMARNGLKRWRIPNTELDFVLVEEGPRTGEYLLSAATVGRLPEFFELVRALPYKPGLGKRLSAAYGAVSVGEAETVYEAYANAPAGLSYIIPPRWLLSMPGWLRVRIVDVTLWQWLGLGVGLLFSALVIVGGHRIAGRLARRSASETDRGWHALPVPLAVIVVAKAVVPLWLVLFRIGGIVRIVLEYIQIGASILSLAWLSVIGCSILAELIVSSERLKHSSLDSQLIRLGLRLVGIAGAIALLIQGADDLGFPAYSIVAGLGVGGLAIALAARETLANLLGSMLIMFEKPFRIGDVIRIGAIEGTVEDVGFRSTRIRTPDNSLISIPSNAVVNSTVENLSVRPLRRQRFFIQVTYDTPREKLEALIAGIQKILDDHPLANSTNFQARLNNLADSSLDILVLFHLDALDYTTELKEREAILFQILALSEELGVAFAYPTRTLRMDAPASA